MEVGPGWAPTPAAEAEPEAWVWSALGTGIAQGQGPGSRRLQSGELGWASPDSEVFEGIFCLFVFEGLQWPGLKKQREEEE